MKTLSRIFVAIAAISAFAACQKELPGPQPESGATKEMTITVCNPETKVVMDNATGDMLWGENESIAVFFGVDAVYKFDQISAGGTSSATFRGTVDEYYAERNITEIYYPYVEGWNINNYRTEGVSTTQNNLVLNAEGQYELGRIPLHWERETMGDDVILQSDRSAIVRLAKADVTHNNGVVKVAMYNNGAKVKDYTVNVATENSKLKDDLVFIVDVPEYDGVRQVKSPKFVLNEGASNERAAIHTGWDETLKTPKTIAPSKRYNVKPYVYFQNINAPAKYAYVVLDNAKLSETAPTRNIYNANWGNIFDVLPLENGTKVYDFGDWPVYDEIWYQRMKMAYSPNNSSVKLTTSTNLTDCDGSKLYAYEKSYNNLTWDSPVGMRGTLDGKECVVVNLGGNVGKVAIATKDVGSTSETGYGSLITWYNAIKNYNDVNGWRLPTGDEINCLGGVRGVLHEGYMEVSSIAGLSSLNFPYAGYISSYGISYSIGTDAFYWGSELYSINLNDPNVHIFSLASHWDRILANLDPSLDFFYSVRQFHSLPLTANSPEGTVGILDGKEAMVLNLNVGGVIRKVAFATKNEGANSKGDYFTGPSSVLYLNCMGSYKTCAEAKALQGNGWRLPTEDEWKALMSSYPNEAGTFLCRDSDITNINKYKYVLDVNVNGAKLRFPAGGLPGSENQMGVIGYYWTGTETPGNPSYNKSAKTMYGHSFTYENYSGGKEYEFSVRLIHDMPQ